MTEKQKKILEDIPKQARGIVDSDDDNDEVAPNLVEMDPSEAAVKKAKIKQKAMREKRK
jgi:hypothetical protein